MMPRREAGIGLQRNPYAISRRDVLLGHGAKIFQGDYLILSSNPHSFIDWTTAYNFMALNLGRIVPKSVRRYSSTAINL